MAQPLRSERPVTVSLRRACRVVRYQPSDRSLKKAVEPSFTQLAEALESKTKARFVLALEAGEVSGDVIGAPNKRKPKRRR